jgi:hypothetical protein
VDDSEVIEAFLEGAEMAFGPSLNVEGSTLKLDGWWSLAYRVSDRAVIVRDEEAPTASTAPADVNAALAARGLQAVGADLPAIGLLTYTNLDLGYAPWVLWSTDLATGEADLNAKATEETFLESRASFDPEDEPANFDHVRGARRVAGTVSSVVLAVGLDDFRTDTLRSGLTDCRLETRAFGEIEPQECAAFLPTLVLVDATGPAGPEFVAELRAGAILDVPIVAVTTGGVMQDGADAALDASDPPDAWLGLIRGLLR